MLLVSKDRQQSDPFHIPFGKQVTLLATGLGAGESVAINIVGMTASGPMGDVCCPGAVVLPEIDWSAPLVTCDCTGTERSVTLTSTKPYVVLDAPQVFSLQAVVTAGVDAVVEVFLEETDSRLK